MATNGQLLARALRNEPLLESEILQLERALNGYDDVVSAVASVRQSDNSWRFQNVHIGKAGFDVPPERTVVYSFVTNGVVPSATDTILSFQQSAGYIKQSDVCIIQPPGHLDRFTKASDVPESRDVFIFGDIAFQANATGKRAVYLDFYTPDDVYSSSFKLGATPTAAGPTTISIAYHTALIFGWYINVVVYQNSGSDVTLDSANIGFALI